MRNYGGMNAAHSSHKGFKDRNQRHHMAVIKRRTPTGVRIDAVQRILLLGNQSLYPVIGIVTVKGGSCKYHIQLKSHKQEKNEKIKLLLQITGFEASLVKKHKCITLFLLPESHQNSRRRQQKGQGSKDTRKQTEAMIGHKNGNRNADQFKQGKHDKITGHKNAAGGSVLFFYQRSRQKPHAKRYQYQPDQQTHYL